MSEMPLLLFTLLTGVVAGAYAVRPLLVSGEEGRRALVFSLVCLIVVGVGSLCAVGHLARPERVFNVLNNPGSSLTMEGLCSGVFAGLILVETVLAGMSCGRKKWLTVLTALAALLLMCVQTYAYATSYGNAVWSSSSTLPFFLLGDLAVGASLLLLLDVQDANAQRVRPLVGVLCLAWAVSLLWMATTIAPYDGGLLGMTVVAAVLSLACAVCAFMGVRKLEGSAGARTAFFVMALVALSLSRYAFYAAISL